MRRLLSDQCAEVRVVFEYDQDTDPDRLDSYCAQCDFVVLLAGINRPQDPAKFTSDNADLVACLLSLLSNRSGCPVLLSSSTQAAFDYPNAASKKAADTVVATFCHNIARDLPIAVNDPDSEIMLAYVDDVAEEFIGAPEGAIESSAGTPLSVPVSRATTLADLASHLHEFKATRGARMVPDSLDSFTTKLYTTYPNFLPEDGFGYLLKTNVDDWVGFTEMVRTADRSQFLVNMLKPGITRGNHWHNTKNEKLLAVSGTGVIRFRKVEQSEMVEYPMSGQDMEAVDVQRCYTHSIGNLGEQDIVVFMWASAGLDPGALAVVGTTRSFAEVAL